MAMVINTNTQATQTYGVYSKNNSYMNEAMTRIATGRKINSAKDNASTWAITQRMRDRIRANDQANQNVQNDSALIRTAQGGISNTIDILTTLRERAINSANDSNLNLDRTAISAEVGQLVDQIQDNATKVKFNGRYLLNGAADSSTTETTTKTTENSKIVEPTAVQLAGRSTAGSHAVYNLTVGNLASFDAGTSKYTAATALTDNLVGLSAGEYSGGSLVTTALTDSSKISYAKDNMIKAGDKITFSWKEDGEDQSYTYEVTSSSTIADLAFEKGHLKLYGLAPASAAVPLTSQETTELVDSNRDGEINSSDHAKNAVYAANGTDTVDAAKSSVGLWAVGDRGVAITDFKVAVTYNDTLNGGVETTRVGTQETFGKFTNTQEAAGEPLASASAYQFGLSTAITAGSESSTKINTLFTTTINDADMVTFNFGGASVELRGDSTVADLQNKFKEQGIAVNVTQAAGTKIKDGDGNYIRKNDAQDDYTVSANALVFAGKTGEDIGFDSISITAKQNFTGNNIVLPKAETTFTNLLVAGEKEEETASETLEIAPSTPLTFHVGGEADFAIDVTIEKMTVDNLFAERDADGNITKIHDTKSFSELFDTKDGAKHALGILDDALNRALAEQTKLGALENRLGYTSDNITTMNENLETAISTYRDSDIAKEMTDYMKYSVLNQASQYMLAQASQNAYSIVQLLQA